jgi:hypothetical protein
LMNQLGARMGMFVTRAALAWYPPASRQVTVRPTNARACGLEGSTCHAGSGSRCSHFAATASLALAGN